MSIVVHSVRVHCGPLTYGSLSPHICRVVIERLSSSYVNGIFYSWKLVNVALMTRLFDNTALLHRDRQFFLVTIIAILDYVGRTVWVVDYLALELFNI